MGVKSPAVVKHLNLVSDISAGVFSGSVVGQENPFRFQTPEKAFSNGIIPAVALAAHAADHLIGLQQCLKCLTAILAATI